jgi:hypothetical protein
MKTNKKIRSAVILMGLCIMSIFSNLMKHKHQKCTLEIESDVYSDQNFMLWLLVSNKNSFLIKIIKL